MNTQFFHIFRNTPMGRETLMQSLYFCFQTNTSIIIYIPEYTKFLMYFENEVVQVDLDSSYLSFPDTARQHVEEIAKGAGVEPVFIDAKEFTASTLPDMPVNFDFMCCPRSVSDLSAKMGLGFIGSRVRKIIQVSSFPVLMPSSVFKKWHSISVLYGGSTNATNALKLGMRIARLTGMPLTVFTMPEGGQTRTDYEGRISESGLKADFEKHVDDWFFFSHKRFEESLYYIPHDSLVILGAYGHGVVKDILFGSKMEIIQGTITNNMLIAGPNYTSRG